MIQREREVGLPNREFKVEVGSNTAELFQLAQGVSRIDLVSDRRFPSRHISETPFTDKSVFAAEVSSIHCYTSKEGEAPKYTLSTTLHLGDTFMLRNGGHFEADKVDSVSDQLKKSGLRVELSRLMGMQSLTVKLGEFEGMINFGFDNNNAREKLMDELEEIGKEIQHPEGIYHEMIKDVEEELKRDETPEQVEKDREWDQAFMEAFANRSEKLPFELERNETISIIFQKSMEGAPIEEVLNNIVAGIPLSTPDDFANSLEVYANLYSSVANAIYMAEEVLPPVEKVILGSAIQ